MAKTRILATIKGVAWRYQVHPRTIECWIRRAGWNFPKAVRIKGRRMFDLAELRDFEAQFEDRLNAREPDQAQKALRQ
jgi:uncharacterized protein YjcR